MNAIADFLHSNMCQNQQALLRSALSRINSAHKTFVNDKRHSADDGKISPLKYEINFLHAVVNFASYLDIVDTVQMVEILKESLIEINNFANTFEDTILKLLSIFMMDHSRNISNIKDLESVPEIKPIIEEVNSHFESIESMLRKMQSHLFRFSETRQHYGSINCIMVCLL